MGQRARRKKRQAAAPTERPAPEPKQTAMQRGYARGRIKDEEARAALKPLKPGERPTAVTIGAIVALLAAVANLVAVIVNLDDGNSRRLIGTALPVFLLLLIAWGM